MTNAMTEEENIYQNNKCTRIFQKKVKNWPIVLYISFLYWLRCPEPKFNFLLKLILYIFFIIWY